MNEINKYNSVSETDDRREIIKQKLRQYYDGRIVRKDLTKSIREGANVPVYVLEYLLGQYCNSDDQEIIDEGVDNVKRILRDNYVRPDEAQKILSLLRERGSYTVIDRITVVLNTKVRKSCLVPVFLCIKNYCNPVNNCIASSLAKK